MKHVKPRLSVANQSSVELSWQRCRFQKASNKVEHITNNPSEEKKKGNSMAGLGFEVGDDLRDICNSPADKTS